MCIKHLFITAGRPCIILILKKKLRPRDANWFIKSSPPWEIPCMLSSLNYPKIATRNINTVCHHWCICHKHRKHDQKAFSKRQWISISHLTLRKRNKVQDVSRVMSLKSILRSQTDLDLPTLRQVNCLT